MVDITLPKDPLNAFDGVSSLVVKQKVDKAEAAAQLAARRWSGGGVGDDGGVAGRCLCERGERGVRLCGRRAKAFWIASRKASKRERRRRR